MRTTATAAGSVPMSHMTRALALARQALGSVSRNPAVGAVIVKDGEVVGEGFTHPPGGPHAEIVALREAGARARGAALYVTLEPCSHQGRTPPCTDAILEAGIAEVHAAMLDPNPNVRAGGLELLRKSGVTTTVGDGEEEAGKIVEAYVKYVSTGLPFVIAKFGISLDGKIATRTGESHWITGPDARNYAHHELRATADAIICGINTALVDDPRLTARSSDGEPLRRQPLRVVVDSQGRMPSDAKMLSEPGSTLVAVGSRGADERGRLAAAGAEALELPAEGGRVDLRKLMQSLVQRDVTNVLVEGGGTLTGAMFDAGIVDKVVAFIAPTIIGGERSPTAVAGDGVQHLSDAAALQRVEVQRLGRDVMVVGYVSRPSGQKGEGAPS